MSFEFLKSEFLLQGKTFKLRRDTLKTPDGRETRVEIIEHEGSVVLLPIDLDGSLLLVRQYRHATGGYLLELPAGTREEGESFDACAAREIREETGMEAGRLQRVGDFYVAPGYSSEYMAVYLATELKYNPLQADDDEFLELEKFPLKEFRAMIERGDVTDAKSLAAWLLGKPHLEKFLD